MEKFDNFFLLEWNRIFGNLGSRTEMEGMNYGTCSLISGCLKARSMMSLVGIIFHVGIMLQSLVRTLITSLGGFTSSAICSNGKHECKNLVTLFKKHS